MKRKSLTWKRGKIHDSIKHRKFLHTYDAKKIINNPHPSRISQTLVTLYYVLEYGPWILSQQKTIKLQVILYKQALSKGDNFSDL